MTEASQTETVEKHRELASAHDRTTEERPGSATIGVGIASGLQFRIDERYEVDGEAEVAVRTGSLGTTMLRGSILDISSTGCYIQSMAPRSDQAWHRSSPHLFGRRNHLPPSKRSAVSQGQK